MPMLFVKHFFQYVSEWFYSRVQYCTIVHTENINQSSKNILKKTCMNELFSVSKNVN